MLYMENIKHTHRGDDSHKSCITVQSCLLTYTELHQPVQTTARQHSSHHTGLCRQSEGGRTYFKIQII